MNSQKKSYFLPETKLGKWTVCLNIFFLIVIIISVILVKVLGILSFDMGHWWDVTALVFLVSISAFIIGIIAVRKNKERSVMVYLSILISIFAILFLLLHSLFIND